MIALNKIIENSPYIAHLGLEFSLENGQVLATLPYKDELIGNPQVPSLHGGIIGAVMELTAKAQIMISSGLENFPKNIDFTTDYLRNGKQLTTYASASITKLGKRVATINAIAWQEDKDKPIAVLHGNFLL